MSFSSELNTEESFAEKMPEKIPEITDHSQSTIKSPLQKFGEALDTPLPTLVDNTIPAVPPFIDVINCGNTAARKLPCRRGRAYSRERSISPYRERYRSYESPSPPPRRYLREDEEEVSSHTTLIPVSTPSKALDRSVRLMPFNRKAYVTHHPATWVEFQQYLSLISLGDFETWYELPKLSDTTIKQAKALDLASLRTHRAILLPPIDDPRPISLNIPQIAITSALTSTLSQLPTTQDPGFIYLTVQTTVQAPPHATDDFYPRPPRRNHPVPDCARGMPSPGTPIYRIVAAGTREAAASRAFYDAGANRFSTVFTCVLHADALNKPLTKDGYKRVESLEGIVGQGNRKGVRVLF